MVLAGMVSAKTTNQAYRLSGQGVRRKARERKKPSLDGEASNVEQLECRANGTNAAGRDAEPMASRGQACKDDPMKQIRL